MVRNQPDALLLSRGHGLVRVLAKGSRRPKASFSGGLEVLTVGAMQAILKPDGALALLTVWELRQPMLHLRTSLASWQHAQIAGEIAARMLSEQDPHPSVYDALVLLLSSLDSTRNTSASLLCFVWTTLCDCGYELELIHDVQTGAELDRADRYGFAPNLGGLTTDPGPDSASAFDQRNPIWRVRGETVSILQRLRGPKPPEMMAQYLRHLMKRQGTI